MSDRPDRRGGRPSYSAHDRTAPDLREFDERIARVRLEKRPPSTRRSFERAARLRDDERKLLIARSEGRRRGRVGDSDV
ncbi:MAG: hypothetical protein R2742_06325 [Micropruina glycogenica]